MNRTRYPFFVMHAAASNKFVTVHVGGCRCRVGGNSWDVDSPNVELAVAQTTRTPYVTGLKLEVRTCSCVALTKATGV